MIIITLLGSHAHAAVVAAAAAADASAAARAVGSRGGGSAGELTAARQTGASDYRARESAARATSSGSDGTISRRVAASARETTGGGETAAASDAMVDAAPPRAHRQLTLDQCPATCFGYTCDDWTNTCAEMEDSYGCVCAGCDCITAAPSASAMPSASPAPTRICFDTDGGAADSSGTLCSDYETEAATGWSSGWGNWCGGFDDADFTANNTCCACGGGSIFSPTSSPTFCYDTDSGATASFDDGCDVYAAEAAIGWSSGWGNWCGNYDDTDFTANDMCCVCSGGARTRTAAPSVSPTVALMVTGSCADSTGSTRDDIYEPIGTTLDGRWYFQGVSSGIWLYFDQDCDGSGTAEAWIFDTPGTQVSTTAEHDLDGDGSCSFPAYFYDVDTEPPLGTNTWDMWCSGSWTVVDLTITQLVPTGAPTITAMPSVSPAPTLCVDMDDGAADSSGTLCSDYETEAATGWSSGWGNWCGNYDDSDFTASDMCCVCGGSASPTSSPTVCFDTDNGAIDLFNNGCGDYAAEAAIDWSSGWGNWCGSYDDEDFSSNAMCCACSGGGSISAFPTVSASPTEAPTITNRPSISPAPTSSPIMVLVLSQMRTLIRNMAWGDELRFDLTLDLVFQNDIYFFGDRSVQLSGDRAASRPTLSGGGSTRFFELYSGASLELKSLVLADGFPGGMNGDDTDAGGAIKVRDGATLILIDCILRDCRTNTAGGGAIWSQYATLFLIDCILRDCDSGYLVRDFACGVGSSRASWGWQGAVPPSAEVWWVVACERLQPS